MKKIFISLLFLIGFYAQGLVDTKNANYTKTFVDLSFPGAGVPLLIERTYNSRSLYNGLFGYGWCSNLETRVDVMPDNTLNAVECGGGQEISFVSKGAKGDKAGIIQQIMAEVKKKKGLTKKYIKQVEKDLHQSTLLQSELIRAFGLKGKVQKGKVYFAVGKQNQTIQMKGNKYHRRLASGHIQIFNSKGQLIQEMDKFRNWVKINRDTKGQIIRLTDNKGRSLRLKPSKTGFEIHGSNKQVAKYVISNDNLTEVVNSKKEEMKFLYDDHHNLTNLRYADKTSETLTYNKKKDWVVSFRNRQDCLETYEYKTNTKNSDHYWTTVKKVCGKRVTNQSRYEFWNKKKPDGSKFLFRARQEVNKRVSDITYDIKTGYPLSITRNRMTTRYVYYPNGQLKSRSHPGKKVTFSGYKNKCKKPTDILVQQFRGKKEVGKVVTKVTYDPKRCYIMMAQQMGTGRWVSVQRDAQGRISQMSDQSKKKIVVQYNEVLNKPKRITRPGVGSIQVEYDGNGRVDPTKVKTNPTVAAQVASVFNGFLEVISPVAMDINI